ncbi:MAG: zinc-ribbon domain-containing protein [Candidatus Thorarchaeota archaeon]|jgi:RNA polymerase subunit RPABC4/transcription elongation factor Spt4
MSKQKLYCRECGTSIPAGAENCPKCGHPVSQAPQSGTRLSADASRSRQTQRLALGDVISRSADQSEKYQMADGFILNAKTGDVWKYDEKSNKFKIVEREDSLLTSAEKAKSYIDQAEELEGRIKDWEDRLSEMGDDSQLANIDLQNAMQKQQQTIQMLSNISKVLHDTALAVIRKIG